MNSPLLYLETSIFGFYFDDQPHNSEKKEAVHLLFKQIQQNLFRPVLSSYTYAELGQPHPFRNALLSLVSSYQWPVMNVPQELVTSLSSRYIEEGALSEDHKIDAIHVASAALLNVDILVSLNLKHIVNTWRIQKFNAVNVLMGYKPLTILTPMEVLFYDHE